MSKYQFSNKFTNYYIISTNQDAEGHVVKTVNGLGSVPKDSVSVPPFCSTSLHHLLLTLLLTVFIRGSCYLWQYHRGYNKRGQWLIRLAQGRSTSFRYLLKTMGILSYQNRAYTGEYGEHASHLV